MYLSSTILDADIPAPLGEHEREEITAEISPRRSLQSPRGGTLWTAAQADAVVSVH